MNVIDFGVTTNGEKTSLIVIKNEKGTKKLI